MPEWISPHRRRVVGRRLLVVLALLALAAVLAAGAVSAFGSERAATVRLGGCSGVNVDRDGLILTARHCGAPETIAVEFLSPPRSVTGRRVFVGEFRADDVAAYRLPPGEYPAVPVARRPPKPGDVVYSFGYPGGRLEALAGRVTGAAQYTDGAPLIVATLPARRGHSGGPLFNLDGELVALCSTSETANAPSRVDGPAESNWIATPRLQAALAFVQGPPADVPQPAPATPRRRLYVFTSVGCEPCRLFRNDYERNIGGLRDWLEREGFERARNGQHYGAVEWQPLGWDRPEFARACEVATGLAPRTVPTFWMEGASDVLVGYAGPEKLTGYLSAQLSVLSRREPVPSTPAEPILEPRTPPASPRPFPRAPNQCEPGIDAPLNDPSAPDWSDATIVLLVARQDRGSMTGPALRLAIDREGGTLRRRLQDATEGRADVRLVSERLSPTRYAAVTEAAGVRVTSARVLVLARRQELGPLRGRLVETIERALGGLSERAPGIPIDLIAERAHPDDYTAVLDALAAPDDPADEAPWWLAPLAALAGLAKRRLLDRA